MLRTEAAWLGAKLADLPVQKLGTILNVGSSTAEFRRHKQPYIDELIFAPLERRSVPVVHFDLQQKPGVDIAGDIFDDQILSILRGVHPNFVICSNILEHVSDRAAFAQRVQQIVPDKAYLLATAPFSFPYHPDPIDTYYRPSPQELAELFHGFDLIEHVVVEDSNYGEVLRSDPKHAIFAFCRLAVPFFKPNHWLGCAHRLKWLNQPFKSSCVLLRKGRG